MNTRKVLTAKERRRLKNKAERRNKKAGRK